MRKILSFNLLLVMRLSDCLHLGNNARMMNIRRQSQDNQNLPHSITPVPPSISLETSMYLEEKLNSKSIQRSLLSKGVSQRRLKEDLRKRRHRRSLSITHSFDVLRSR